MAPGSKNKNLLKVLENEALMASLAKPALKLVLHDGMLKIKKDRFVYAVGDSSGPVFTVEIDDWQTVLKIFGDPDLCLGETYANGEWKLVQGDLGRFMTWLVQNNRDRIMKMPAPVRKDNTPGESRKNVGHHYDLGNDLYQSFLDEGMNYSCAFFDDYRMSLRDAQLNKIYTTISRSDIKPGMRVLDIGSGWGDMSRVIARCHPDVKVTGITLSERQLEWATERREGPEPQYVLSDYREYARKNPGIYDRIISVGMFEHVGREHYEDYFKAVFDLLKPGGRALVHSIMRPEAGTGTSKWMDSYIFPGGCIPFMPDTLEAAHAQGLEIPQVPYIHESGQYAETLRRWRQNYNKNRKLLDQEKYDDRFHRIWNFYLASSEAAFDGMGYYVAQIILQKPL